MPFDRFERGVELECSRRDSIVEFPDELDGIISLSVLKRGLKGARSSSFQLSKLRARTGRLAIALPNPGVLGGLPFSTGENVSLCRLGVFFAFLLIGEGASFCCVEAATGQDFFLDFALPGIGELQTVASTTKGVEVLSIL